MSKVFNKTRQLAFSLLLLYQFLLSFIHYRVARARQTLFNCERKHFKNKVQSIAGKVFFIERLTNIWDVTVRL